MKYSKMYMPAKQVACLLFFLFFEVYALYPSELRMPSVFGDNTSVVLASMKENNTALTVVDSSNQEWSTTDLNYGEDGSISFNLGTQIPESSTCAAIFGLFVIAFAIYRKRK